ncbi:MAG TPA: Asd/ArgC dimerization domain-containing protein [Candidatus Acidoferrales bacterium]|nr:Asd/ArgC dimerization domain-containing protein [Candidatus Acidoferrales bacterium]
MTLPSEVGRIVVAGAASLRGKELVEALEQSKLAAAELRLLDEEIVAGALTEAGGEPVVVLAVDEDSFERAQLVIFAGGANFAFTHVEDALRAGAKVVDMSGGLVSRPDARIWIPALDATVLPRSVETASPKASAVYVSPSAAGIVACSLAGALAEWPDCRLTIVFLQPVSERGSEGIEELEAQTVKLLSFQPIAQPVFDEQVAFNLLDRYGEASTERLSDARDALALAVKTYLDGRAPLPAVQVIQAPAFFSYAFSAFAEFDESPDRAAVESRLAAAGFQFVKPGDPGPSNVRAGGEATPLLSRAERDPNRPNGLWLWGAVDNMRLAAANAVAISERAVGIST